MIMKEMELLGKNCRDIVTGFEGVCIGVMEHFYGCKQLILKPKSEDGRTKTYNSYYFEKQLEVIDDGIREKVEIPVYHKPLYMGKECRDKVTGVVGMCVGRIIWLFNCDQYVLEIQPEDYSKEPRLAWLDDGRVEETRKKEIKQEEVAGTRTGGMLEKEMYPSFVADEAIHETGAVHSASVCDAQFSWGDLSNP